eukprot:COSAG01_NODE_16684_length_1215_cov_1.103943_2_plen_115_part_01
MTACSESACARVRCPVTTQDGVSSLTAEPDVHAAAAAPPLSPLDAAPPAAGYLSHPGYPGAVQHAAAQRMDGGGGESFLRVHWVVVAKVLRARRVSTRRRRRRRRPHADRRAGTG